MRILSDIIREGLRQRSVNLYDLSDCSGPGDKGLITLLTGRIIELGENTVTLDVGGVGFEVEIPSSTRAGLPGINETTSLFTCLHLRPEEIRLFGFATRGERRLFEILTSIQKVGVKTGLDILSALSLEDFHAAIRTENLKALMQVRGIGRKLAERILFELKEKIGLLPLPEGHAVGATGPLPMGEKYNQAVEALTALGCKPFIAQRAVNIAYETLGADAPLADLIREGLKHRNG